MRGPTGPAGPIAGSSTQFIYNNGGSAAGANAFQNSAGRVNIGTTDFTIPTVYGGGGVTAWHDATAGTDRIIMGHRILGDNTAEAQLYLLDDGDSTQRFTIYGNSCGGGNCGDLAAASVQHIFDSIGNAWHRGVLRVAAGADIAEITPVTEKENLSIGDVVVIDGDDGLRVTRSSKPCDTSVYGIISSYEQASMVIGDDPEGDGIHTHRLPVALIGRVDANVTVENGVIKPGDLLVTSSTPGHLMKCSDIAKCAGAIAGKALESLESGKGMIKILVTLQ